MQASGDMARRVRKLIQLLAGSNIPHNDGTVVTCGGHPATPNEYSLLYYIFILKIFILAIN
jgi:hypothetical protein